ncbi:MAG: hypothetical protein UU72_C0022G0006 [candidate division WWE3 bacterium GW2011_GWB1_41_6]|uniref:Uncharacterized protein n=1 Tax=candidate division WWE3 bacterium GW2011_GWB1_41_6 TaxID=1619112 RepID=A0A0G0WUG7_UNCKA|nr:MAG: hypothetical protein UU72_C0022G0006 [candidate division WWE3 bacterium GW2011_GWB1_41_6]
MKKIKSGNNFEGDVLPDFQGKRAFLCQSILNGSARFYIGGNRNVILLDSRPQVLEALNGIWGNNLRKDSFHKVFNTAAHAVVKVKPNTVEITLSDPRSKKSPEFRLWAVSEREGDLAVPAYDDFKVLTWYEVDGKPNLFVQIYVYRIPKE